jgi:triosephosphate isomerase
MLVGNWKMHKTPSETEALLSELITPLVLLSAEGRMEIALAPSFTSLPLAARILAGSGIALCGQDCHWSDEGPYTGEVSAQMLVEVGCRYVLLGHSERREHFAETSRTVNMKAKRALFWGMTPIICVGEKEDERAAGRTEMVVEAELKRCLADLVLEKGQRLMVAYEPVWAIGTGKTPEPTEVDEVHRLIRSELEQTFGKDAGARLPVLYGGSVNHSNVGVMMSLEAIDGVLVGGASLTARGFLSIAEQVAGGRGQAT